MKLPRFQKECVSLHHYNLSGASLPQCDQITKFPPSLGGGIYTAHSQKFNLNNTWSFEPSVLWGHGTGSFISTGIFPKPQSLLITLFHALFLHSAFPSILAKSTPLTPFATVVLCVFPISFPQKCKCIVWLYYFAGTWFSHICL